MLDPMLDGEQFEWPVRLPAEIALEQQFLESRDERAGRSGPEIWPSRRTEMRSGLGFGGMKRPPILKNCRSMTAIAVSTWLMPLGKPERINLVAAIKHDVGQTGAAEEHADHRHRILPPWRSAISSRGTRCGREVALGDVEQSFERGDRVALRPKIQGNEIGLAVGQHRDRRRRRRRNGGHW